MNKLYTVPWETVCEREYKAVSQPSTTKYVFTFDDLSILQQNKNKDHTLPTEDLSTR